MLVFLVRKWCYLMGYRKILYQLLIICCIHNKISTVRLCQIVLDSDNNFEIRDMNIISVMCC